MKTPKDIIVADLGEAPDDWRSNPDYKVDLNTAENWMIQYAEQFHPKVFFKEWRDGDEAGDLPNYVWDTIYGFCNDRSAIPFEEDIILNCKISIEIKVYEND